MRKAIFCLLSLLFMLPPLTSAESNPLESFRWDYRIILVSAPATEVDDLANQLNEAKAAISERHILWFVIGGEAVATNYSKPLNQAFQAEVLKSYFKDASGETEVRLIGKDGGVKEKSKKLNLKRLFKRIDSMPMRQAEMRER